MSNIENLYKSILLSLNDFDIKEDSECNLNTFNSIILLLFNLINKHHHLIHIKVNDKLLSDYILPVVKIFCQQDYSDWIAIGNHSLGIDINEMFTIDLYILKVWIKKQNNYRDYYYTNDAYEMHGIIELQLRSILLQSLNF
jgi:hypothetical protein